LHTAHRIVLNAHVRAGPAFEQKSENGVSHFLEHMLYRGIVSHPTAHEQAEAFESLGGTLSAMTYVDYGSLAIAVPPESFDAVLPLFAEVYLRPLFDGIEIERGIVREEILEGVDHDGNSVNADELVRELTFEGHPFGYPIAGDASTLSRMDKPMVAASHRRFYTASGSVLAIAGPIDPERIARAVETAFADLPRGTPILTTLPEPQTAPRFRHVNDSASQTALRVGFRAPGDGAELEPAIDMLLRVLDDGMSTRLYHRMCDELGICYDVSAGYEGYTGVGFFDFAAEVENTKSPDVLAELLNLCRNIRDDGPSDAELDKAKKRLRWFFRDLLDDAAEASTFVASGTLSGVAPVPHIREEQLLAVSKEDVKEAASQMFRRESLNLLAVGKPSRRALVKLTRAVEAFG
jgi:predicted Zn-dependent peptidase